MNRETKYLFAEFEKEVWLFLDNDLPGKRMHYWNEQISKHAELKDLLDENKNILESYNQLPLSQLSESRYAEILSSVVKKKSRRRNLFSSLNPFSKSDRHIFSPAKIAFGGTLAAAAIVILLLVNKPNPVKDIGNELLDWNADKITNQIDDVEATLSFIKDDDIKKYLQKKAARDKVDREIYSISNEIEKIKNELDDRTL